MVLGYWKENTQRASLSIGNQTNPQGVQIYLATLGYIGTSCPLESIYLSIMAIVQDESLGYFVYKMTQHSSCGGGGGAT